MNSMLWIIECSDKQGRGGGKLYKNIYAFLLIINLENTFINENISYQKEYIYIT